ncbi:hypothetical protein CBL_11833 [Carabus blaptoides fortunei]
MIRCNENPQISITHHRLTMNAEMRLSPVRQLRPPLPTANCRPRLQYRLENGNNVMTCDAISCAFPNTKTIRTSSLCCSLEIGYVKIVHLNEARLCTTERVRFRDMDGCV